MAEIDATIDMNQSDKTLVDQCEGADSSTLRVTEANNVISPENHLNRNGLTFPEYVGRLKDAYVTYCQERTPYGQELIVERLVGGVPYDDEYEYD